MKKSFFITFLLSGFAALISVCCGKYIVCWFLSEPTDTILAYTQQYLNTISCFYIPLAFIFLYRNALQGLNRGFIPMLSGIFEMVCRVIIVLFLLEPLGYQAVCFASPAAWLGAGIPLIITYFLWQKQMKKALLSTSIPE